MFSTDSTHPTLLKALLAKGYESPTPVQAMVADAPREADLLVSARTGSGKTVAFGLAMAHAILGDEEHFPARSCPRALIIAPTRELATQVARELSWLYAGTSARNERVVATCVGGSDARSEARALDMGPSIVVGTPGRLCDHLRRGRLDLSGLKVAVLDEADEMLDMGFRDELEAILKAAPAERRTLMFSATLPKEIEQLARAFQKGAVRIAANALNEQHSDIEVQALLVSPIEIGHAVVNVLREADAAAAIVFCATRDGTARMWSSLRERGFQAVALSGELSQNERNRALQALRDGTANILVATDVAARGLDLPSVGLIIHADLPNDKEVFQHRNGRTGRAGKKGRAVLIVAAPKRRRAEFLLRDSGLRPNWMEVPSAERIEQQDRSRVVGELLMAAELADPDAMALASQALSKALLDAGSELTADAAPEQAIRLIAAFATSLVQRLPVPEEMPETLRLNQRRVAPPEPSAATRQYGETGRDAGSHHLQAPAVRSGAPSRPAGDRGEVQAVWFRVNVGRRHNADPRWLIPLICRRGDVEKSDIGSIRIVENETRFQIGLWAAEHFDRAVRRPDRKDPQVRFAVGEE
ncbi:MAG: DEAD/DEAH box helicase [Deltaproteobacteria bacterium]|nr:DEAD/DEAH box helicase [Deltaproteobacteria bacterium]